MPQTIITVDAFTDRPFAGNPAAVCVMDGPADEAWMQRVAAEMNLSETAFLHPRDDGWSLRWFTPAVEVALCGHATLASAHVLWQDGRLTPDAVARFHTRSGLLTAARDGDWITLDFPAKPEEQAPAPDGLEQALGTRIVYAGRSVFDWLVEVESEEVVHGLAPDLTLLGNVEARGVIVTARAAGGEHDFVSRFFAPRVGVPEDPVTGSAHCVLAPFWAARLGRDTLTGFQASRRGGVVKVRVAGDRVMLGGQAVTVVRGELV
ncbi:PhzF family phenazine biosynthesis protein [Longimicrobium sp.]|uniref:PhzF family phenazine biosynthesis protein n=1 Tax=Longimicrobium sp. TaxID=2029185 RepID=UPI002E338AF8|nr:PhzF family phenazine biosynthesis protein [Longimicrobium sp.]HEX6037293.1 PhzF family phenazine biosynthesis protein [Longimicrobium sp.]